MNILIIQYNYFQLSMYFSKIRSFYLNIPFPFNLQLVILDLETVESLKKMTRFARPRRKCIDNGDVKERKRVCCGGNERGVPDRMEHTKKFGFAGTSESHVGVDGQARSTQ